jgi:hypothetical protein
MLKAYGRMAFILAVLPVAGCITPNNQQTILLPGQPYTRGDPGAVANMKATPSSPDEAIQVMTTQVRVNHEVGAITVTVGNWEVIRDANAASIKIHEYDWGPALTYILVQKNSNNPACPIMYQAMNVNETVFHPNIQPVVSKEFGDCNEASKIETAKGALVLTMSNKDGSATEYSYAQGNVTERRVEKIVCVHAQGSSSELLPCNSCELEKKARDAMADGYDKIGFANIGATYRSDTTSLGLQESKDKDINATVAESLRGKAKPEDIRVCLPPDLPGPMVVEYIKWLGLHGFVANYGIPGVVTPFE